MARQRRPARARAPKKNFRSLQAHARDHALAANSRAQIFATIWQDTIPKNLIIRLSNAKNDTKPGTAWPHWSTVVTEAAALVTCARHLSRAINAAAVARVGIKMSKKFNTRFTKILKLHDEWLRAQGYKPLSSRTQDSRPQAKGSSLSPESTSSRTREPG